jgi:superfamily II DNA/RNA helicase
MGEKSKITMLHDILIQEEVSKTLIFARTKHGVEKLSRELKLRGFKVDALHGNRTQFQRQQVLMKFKQNQINILVATDVASRGLDIPNVSHVINYEEPEKYEDYIHRIGRTGRGNSVGKALTFV